MKKLHLTGLILFWTFKIHAQETASQINQEISPQINIDSNQLATPDQMQYRTGCPSPLVRPGGIGSETDIELWLDASTITEVNGAQISNWGDKSGNAIVASQINSVNKPIFRTNAINGKSAVDFDGWNDYLNTGSIPDLNTNHLSWSVVCFAESLQNGTVISSGYTSGSGITSGHLWKSYISATNYISITRNSAGGVGGSINHGSIPSYVILTNAWDGSTGINRGYTNGLLSGVQSGMDANPDGHIRISLGARSNGATSFFDGRIAEAIVYSKTFNKAERIILDNYLAAKYNISLAASDIYAYESTHAYDVAGIGMSGTDFHTASRGSIVEMSNASSLSDGKFALWGHDNGTMICTSAGAPAAYGTTGKRMGRVWRVDKTGNVGTVKIQFHLDGIATGASTDFELLIDSDGDFSNAVRVTTGFSYDATCNIATWTNVNPAKLYDGAYFTIGNPNGLALMQIPASELAILGEETPADGELTAEETIEQEMEESTLEIYDSRTETIQMKLYPNPTEGSLTIENSIDGASIEIYNSVGELVFNTTVLAGKNQYNFNYLSAGIYIVHLKDITHATINISQLMITK